MQVKYFELDKTTNRFRPMKTRSDFEYQTGIRVEHEATHVMIEIDAFDQLCDDSDLCEQLKRIAIERSNAERNLVPKKKHTGYVFKGNARRNEMWTETFETPYDSMTQATEIDSLVVRDLYNEPLMLAKRLGLYEKGYHKVPSEKPDMSKFSDYDMYDGFVKEYKTQRVDRDMVMKYWGNIVTNIEYRLNNRGMWEVLLTHPIALKQIPSDMIKK